MTRPTFMTIDLMALQHNYKRVTELAPKSKIIAMVKANAYGHGIKRVAKALPDAHAFGVASLEEGMLLRDAGITQPIVLMEGLFEPHELEEASRYDFTLVVHHKPHVEMLASSALVKPLSVWIKINTGMNRLGFSIEEAGVAYRELASISSVRHPVGLMTHFAAADDTSCDSMTLAQIQRFQDATRTWEGARSLANSAGILAWPDAHADWVRPGLILYGASPFSHNTGLAYDLQPVMTLSSRLIAINSVKRGERVGYGATWIAPNDTRVGVVGIGYGDGYPQGASNGTPVLVRNERCELVGRVSMDMLTVDLTKVPDAQIGDSVVLWGRGLPVEEVARFNHTTPWELLTRMTPRPQMKVVMNSADSDAYAAVTR